MAVFMVLSVSACATDLQTKVAGNLMALSKDQTVALLPIETSDPGQKEMAKDVAVAHLRHVTGYGQASLTMEKCLPSVKE